MEKSNVPVAADPKLERQISMEEPKTLSEAELTFFREAALKILNTHSPDEAARVFMGGTKAVVAPPTEQVETTGTAKN